MAFDSIKIASEINALAARIELNNKKTLDDQWEIGRKLNLAKNNFGWGEYMPWFKEHVNLSHSQACKCRRLAKYPKDANLSEIMQKIHGRYKPKGKKMLQCPIDKKLMISVELKCKSRGISVKQFVEEIIARAVGYKLGSCRATTLSR